MTQSLLRLWYKLILKRHNLRETVVPIHLDFMWSLSTLNLKYFPPSCSLWSEKEGWNLKGRCRSSGRDKKRESERPRCDMRHYSKSFSSILKQPSASHGPRRERDGDGCEEETGWSSSQLLQSTPSSREQSVTACSITVLSTYWTPWFSP